MLLLSTVLAQDISIHESLTAGAGSATVYGGTFTGAGWRVDDSNSRLLWDFGTQVERGYVSFVVDDVEWANLVGDNNEFIQMFDAGDKWSCTRAVTFRVYGDLDGDSWGDIKLKTWDNTSGLYSEARGGVQDWDGGPHTWTITWDTTSATLSRDGVQLVYLDVTGQDLRVGTLWLPLNAWISGYSHPIGSVYSDLSFDAWLPDDGGGDNGGETGGETGGSVPDGEFGPIEDVGVIEAYGATVYDGTTDLPMEGGAEASYLLFDLSSLSGTVTNATLTLHAQSDAHADGDGGGVYAVADTSWSEDTLAWAGRPSLGALLATFGAVHADDAVTIDVTAGVTAGGRVALAVANGGDNGVHFWSKEGAISPSLAVSVTPDSGEDSGTGGDDTDLVDEGGDSGAGDDAAEQETAEPTAKDGAGCGCASTGVVSAPWVLALWALVRRARR